MRPPAVAFLIGLLATSMVVAADPPIPQDPAFMKQRSQDWLAWNRQTLGDFYQKSGKRSPRWDKQAAKTLDLTARMFSLQTEPFVPVAELHAAARAAVEAGCDDPLVLYVYAQTSVIPNFPGNDEFARRLQRASDALEASSCSPFRKSVALYKTLQLKQGQAGKTPTAAQVHDLEAGIDKLFDLLAQSVRVDPRGEFWEGRWYDNIRVIQGFSQGLTKDSKAAFDKVDARLAKVPGIEPLRLALRGRFFVDWGWEARSNAFAPMVSEKQFESFHDRLVEARRSLEAAYKLNPKQPGVAQMMMSVELGDGDGDREAMELWFRRALELDPNDSDSCARKLYWLEPKWHGDPEGKEMLAFGKACAATNNWIGQLTLLQADAITDYAACNLPRTEQGRYFFETENWTPMASVYDEYLKHFPNDALKLSQYAYRAYSAGRIGLAHQMFQRAGDNLTGWNGGSTSVAYTEVCRARDYVAKQVQEQKTRKAGQNPKP